MKFCENKKSETSYRRIKTSSYVTLKMTATASSSKKLNVFNDAYERNYEPYPDITPSSEIYLDVPWPEWNDSEINFEDWDDHLKQRASTINRQSVEEVFFEDKNPPNLPVEVRDHVHEWKRPHFVFPNAKLRVYEPTNVQFELSVPSFVADCSLFQKFNELLPILQCFSVRYIFPVECETSNYVPNTQGEPWHPWHHIYSLCKAGKGVPHRPLYNHYGKYLIRLFYMGAWRKFVVDDSIPCDREGLCMLPVTQVTGELWPLLLVKALLKILNLTSCSELNLVDFSFLTFFTGWVNWRVNATNKTVEQIWRRFMILIPRYEFAWNSNDGRNSITTKKDPTSKGSTRDGKTKEHRHDKFCLLLANLEDLPENSNLLRSHSVAVTMSRSTPLVMVPKKKPTETWKRIRWVYWASEKGIWTDERRLPPYRRLQCITFVKPLGDFLKPDPMQEAAMFDYSEMNFSNTETEKSYVPEDWADFFKFHQYLDSFNLHFKPSFFSSTFKVTSLRQAVPHTPTDFGRRGTAKIVVPNKMMYVSPNLKPTCNGPVMLFCESVTGIILCMSLWVCPKKPKESGGYLDKNQPEVLKISHASLLVEEFDWRTIERGEIIGMMKTVGNSCICLNLRPGRHVLNLWINSDSPYVLDVYSNTEVTVHAGAKIRFLMNTEAERILEYINEVSTSFIALAQSFGKPDYQASLRRFYDAVKPGNNLVPNYRKKMNAFIEIFLKCMMDSLKSLIPNAEDLRLTRDVLRSLFINPRILCDIPKSGSYTSSGKTSKKAPKKGSSETERRPKTVIMSQRWTSDEIGKIIMIQRIYRGHRDRLLKKRQSPTSKDFKAYTERLRKICDLMFTPGKREYEVGRLIRKVMMAEPEIFITFKFYEDIRNVIHVEEFKGEIPHVEPCAWVPITRFIIASHCDEPAPCAFYFSSNLGQFFVLGVDNDTNREIFRLSNCISPHYYHRNTKGYTILVCGWNDSTPKTVYWRLEIVKMKYFQVIHLCNTLLNLSCHPYNLPVVEVLQLRNIYIPNHKSRVCRCLIKIQKRTLLTLRMSMSYSEVEFFVTISLDRRFTPALSYGDNQMNNNNSLGTFHSLNGAVLLPSMVLERVEPNAWWGESNSDGDPTIYILEAYVVGNSWPLTKTEWEVVEPILINGEDWKESSVNVQASKMTTESKRRTTRMSKKSFAGQKALESPYWWLQVLNDFPDGADSDPIIIEEDRSYFEMVKTLKASWEEKDPGRKRRGRQMRQDFLALIALEEQKYREEYFEDISYSEMKVVEEEEDNQTDDIFDVTDLCSKAEELREQRYSKSPRVLPWMPTADLLRKYSRRGGTRLESIDDSTTVEEESDYSGKLTDVHSEPAKIFSDHSGRNEIFLKQAKSIGNLNEWTEFFPHSRRVTLVDTENKGQLLSPPHAKTLVRSERRLSKTKDNVKISSTSVKLPKVKKHPKLFSLGELSIESSKQVRFGH